MAEFGALSLYIIFMGFCFCDGFRLHTGRKLVWFLVFTALAIFVFKSKGEFILSLILPIPTILAIILCAYEKMKRAKKDGAI